MLFLDRSAGHRVTQDSRGEIAPQDLCALCSSCADPRSRSTQLLSKKSQLRLLPYAGPLSGLLITRHAMNMTLPSQEDLVNPTSPLINDHRRWYKTSTIRATLLCNLRVKRARALIGSSHRPYIECGSAKGVRLRPNCGIKNCDPSTRQSKTRELIGATSPHGQPRLRPLRLLMRAGHLWKGSRDCGSFATHRFAEAERDPPCRFHLVIAKRLRMGEVATLATTMSIHEYHCVCFCIYHHNHLYLCVYLCVDLQFSISAVNYVVTCMGLRKHRARGRICSH